MSQELINKLRIVKAVILQFLLVATQRDLKRNCPNKIYLFTIMIFDSHHYLNNIQLIICKNSYLFNFKVCMESEFII